MIALLYGGGLDSTALALMLGDAYTPQAVHLVHVDYGQAAAGAELVAAGKLHARGFRLHTLSVPLRYSHAAIMHEGVVAGDRAQNVLPLRNVVLLSVAASYCATREWEGRQRIALYIGFHREDDNVFPDAHARWLTSMENVLTRASHHAFHLHAPFSHLSRLAIAQSGYRFAGREFFDIAHTCYQSTPCGRCAHCDDLEAIKAEVLKSQ